MSSTTSADTSNQYPRFTFESAKVRRDAPGYWGFSVSRLIAKCKAKSNRQPLGNEPAAVVVIVITCVPADRGMSTR